MMHVSRAMPCSSRREAVFAAVEAYNRTHPAAPLPRPTARLLAVDRFAADFAFHV